MRDIYMQIVKVLRESDREHPMTQGEIAERVKGPSGKSIDRKTVNAAFKDLKEELDLVDLKKQGWYLDTREGISYELALLIGEAIMTSPVLRKEDRESAVRLIGGLFSREERRELTRNLRMMQGPEGGISLRLVENIHEAIRGRQPLLLRTKEGRGVHIFPRDLVYQKDCEGLALHGYHPGGMPAMIPLADIDAVVAQEMKEYMRDERGVLVEEGPFVVRIEGLPYYSFAKDSLTEKEARAAYADFRNFAGRNTLLHIRTFDEALFGDELVWLAKIPDRYRELSVHAQLKNDMKVFLSYALLLKERMMPQFGPESTELARFAFVLATSSSAVRNFRVEYRTGKKYVHPVAFAHLVQGPFTPDEDWCLSGPPARIPETYPLDERTFPNFLASCRVDLSRMFYFSPGPKTGIHWLVYPLCYYLYDKKHRRAFRPMVLDYVRSWNEIFDGGKFVLYEMAAFLSKATGKEVPPTRDSVLAEIESLPVE